MFCTRCLHRLPKSYRPQSLRLLTTTSPTRLPSDPPAATSTSTPFSSSPPSLETTPKKSYADTESVPRVRSSVPAGKALRGLGYIKGQDWPIAKKDSEYPDWLWGLLDQKKKGKDKGGDGAGEGDLFSKSKKQRRLAAKKALKASILDPSLLVPKIPLHEQTIDLPVGDGSGGAEDVEARRAREGVTAAMRVQRRKGIKERNFLGTMI